MDVAAVPRPTISMAVRSSTIVKVDPSLMRWPFSLGCVADRQKSNGFVHVEPGAVVFGAH
jgi:hypothetical protein